MMLNKLSPSSGESSALYDTKWRQKMKEQFSERCWEVYHFRLPVERFSKLETVVIRKQSARSRDLIGRKQAIQANPPKQPG